MEYEVQSWSIGVMLITAESPSMLPSTDRVVSYGTQGIGQEPLVVDALGDLGRQRSGRQHDEGYQVQHSARHIWLLGLGSFRHCWRSGVCFSPIHLIGMERGSVDTGHGFPCLGPSLVCPGWRGQVDAVTPLPRNKIKQQGKSVNAFHGRTTHPYRGSQRTGPWRERVDPHPPTM